jgi:hypothetical protein
MFYRSVALIFALFTCLSEASSRNLFRQCTTNDDVLVVVPRSSSFQSFRVLSTIRGGGGGLQNDDTAPGVAVRGYMRRRGAGAEQIMPTIQMPSDQPTIMKISNTVQSYFVDSLPDSAKNKAPSSVTISKEPNFVILSSALRGIKNVIVNTFIAYPSLKYVLVAIMMFAVIAFVKESLFVDKENSCSPVMVTGSEELNSSTLAMEATEKQQAPMISLEQVKPKVFTATITHISKRSEEGTQQFISLQPTRPQMMIFSLVIGGIGIIAGTIALVVAETAEIGLLGSSNQPRINLEQSSSLSLEGQDSCIHRSCDDAKKVGAGAAGGILASGMVGRAVIIGKVLNFLF